MSNVKKSNQVAAVGIFAAVIVVLQLVSSFVKIGSFPLNLTLIPVVLGAIIYGPKIGSMLGSVFGVIIAICCIAGLDAGGNMLFQMRPFVTVIVCVLRGFSAGLLPGLVFNAFKGKNNNAATFLSAASAPICSTGLFLICMVLFFKEALIQWANGTNTVYFIFTGLVGWNFVIELIINIVAAPLLLRVLKAIKKI